LTNTKRENDKKDYILILLLVFSTSCNLPKVKVKKSKNNVENGNNEMAKFLTDLEVERAVLISKILDIDSKKTISVIIDYNPKVISTNCSIESNPNYFEKLIDSFATKHRLSPKKITAIIYSYEYNAITLTNDEAPIN
jgi:hypothetical protein